MLKNTKIKQIKIYKFFCQINDLECENLMTEYEWRKNMDRKYFKSEPNRTKC